jgi:hypothetical protein
MEQLDSFLQRQRQEQLQAINDEVTEIARVIAEKIPRERVTERAFVEIFLPVFRGDVKPDEINNILLIWANVAKATTREVMIVDDHNRDLFIVPPIHDTTIIDLENKAGTKSLSVMVAESANLSARVPALGMNHAMIGSDAKARSLFKESEMADFRQRWQSVFDRYASLKVDKIQTQAAAPAEIGKIAFAHDPDSED